MTYFGKIHPAVSEMKHTLLPHNGFKQHRRVITLCRPYVKNYTLTTTILFSPSNFLCHYHDLVSI